MEQVATANIDGAAAVRLAGTDSGWARTTVLKNGDTVTVLTYPAADDGAAASLHRHPSTPGRTRRG